METSLHRELKLRYGGPEARTEVRLGAYRIDAIADGRLIEIQHGSLAAIRDKIRRLSADHDVLLVKPIVARKRIVRLAKKTGLVLSQRTSPKRGTLLSAFDELVYFTRAFPHPRLTLELLLVEVEEFRTPGHGRRRRWRQDDHVVVDQCLYAMGEARTLRTAADLIGLLPAALPETFDTAELALLASVPRGAAQRMAYCLRQIGAIEQIGKRRGAWLYRVAEPCEALRSAA